MEITGKVHCFFEQSGTFKNEFIKLGIPAEYYDIQNNFGQTDHQIDLFQAIEDAYDGKPSVFDNIRGGGFDNGVFPLHILLLLIANGFVLVCEELPKNEWAQGNGKDT